MKKTTLAQGIRLLVFIVLLITFGVASVSAAPAQFRFMSTLQGDCVGGATITFRVYAEGEINTGVLLDEVSTTTTSAGGYLTLSSLGELEESTTYDINISAQNNACSPSALGSIAVLSRSTFGATTFPPATITETVTLSTIFDLTAPGNNSVQATNQTTFSWLNDYPSVTFTLQVSSDADFSSIIRDISGIATTSYTLSAAQELEDGTYYVRVRVVNASSSIIDTSAVHSFTVSAHEAVISNPVPANNSWTNAASHSFSVQTDKDAVCRYSSSSGVPFASKTLMSSTGSTTHSTTASLTGGDGTKVLHIQCNASNGVVNGEDYHLFVRLDTIAPSASGASVIINGGASHAIGSTTLSMTWSGFTDSGSGILRYYYSFINGGGTSSGTDTMNTFGSLSNANQGMVQVYVWAQDVAGNIGLAASSSIVVDTLPPVFSHWSSVPVDLTKYSTGDYRLNFRVTDSSSLSYVRFRYRIGEDDWSAWQDATHQGGVLYTLVIAEQASPNTWFERNGENLTYQINASDTHGFTNEVTRFEFINDESLPPVLEAVDNQVVYQDELLSFGLSGSDPDLNDLTYSCNMTQLTVTQVNNSFANVSWTPNNEYVGVHTVMCNVTDGMFITSRSFTITVINVNDDPILEVIGGLYAHEYVLFNYTLNASDPDDDLLLFFSNATFFSVNSITGLIFFTPHAVHRGVHSINFSVDDMLGGVDWEVVSFTIGYCGDGVCRADYEDCSSCASDCGVCKSDRTRALIVDPRNCLDEQMSIRAVSLVERATCEEKGAIIDDLEVCGVESDRALEVVARVDDAWELVSELVTDEQGRVTFTPEQEGVFRVRFVADRDEFTPFEVKACAAISSPGVGVGDAPSPPRTTDPSMPPIVEEPTIIDEVDSGWTLYAVLLYFVVIPFLLVIVLVGSLNYWYRSEKRKGSSSGFVVTLDRLASASAQKRAALVVWMNKTPPMNYVLDAVRVVRSTVSLWLGRISDKMWSVLGKTALGLGFKRSARLPFLVLSVPEHKRLHVLLVSLLKKVFPQRSVDEMMLAVQEYQLSSLLDVAALLVSNGVRVRVQQHIVSQEAYIRLLMSKGADYRRAELTRVDVESAISGGSLVVVDLGRRPVVVYAFDQEGFYYHDYLVGKAGVGVRKEELLSVVARAGGSVVVVEKSR